MSGSRIDAEQVKAAAAGRELELLEYVAHLDRSILDGKHHPCPRCGGKDRFRLIDAKAGSVLCNGCFRAGNGDFLAAIQHFRGISFPQAIEEAAYRLGIVHSLGGNAKSAPAGRTTTTAPATAAGANQEGGSPAVDPLVRMAETKNCPVESLRAFGGVSFPEKGACAFPMFDGNGVKVSQFNVFPDSPDAQQRKGMNAKGKQAGLFFPIVDGAPRLPKHGETWLVVEGVKDAAALHGIGYANTCGPSGKYLKSEWLPLFKDVRLVLVLNNDPAGVEAAAEIKRKFEGKGPAAIRILTLPAAGDVRDNIKAVGVEAVKAAIDRAVQEREAELPEFVRLIDCQQFLALDLKPRFLVRGVLVAGQPAVIGGRSKTLKTSIATDLVVSLGSGTSFLGEFPAERVTVAFWSGESGATTLRETAFRIARSRGVDLADCSILWNFALPKLSRQDHLGALENTIRERHIDVAVLDPLYLMLLSGETANQAGNVFAMGSALAPLGEIGQRTRCTMIVLHHFRKSGQPDPEEPAAIEELSQSGVSEWCRQWALLARRSPYAADGHHELYLRCGGSFGHAGLWGVDVDEGLLDPDTLDGRRWDVAVRPIRDVRDEARRAAENRKAEQAARRADDDRRKMVEALRRCPHGETQTALRQLAGLSGQRAADALRSLVGDGHAEFCEVTKYTRKEQGYKPTGK